MFPLNEVFVVIPLFLLGLCIGSFINVVAYRLPRRESIVLPGSHCPQCKQSIAFYDNLPLLSFIILRGRCRHCRKRISLQYPLVEFVAGVILPLCFYLYGFGLQFFRVSLFLYLLLPLFIIDLRSQVVPDKITIPGIIAGFASSFFLPDIAWYDSLIGVGAGGVLLLVIAALGRWVFKREAMGMGDVTLFMLVGAFLGWQKVILTLILASIAGSIIGLAIVARKRKKFVTVPFGPFIVVGTVVSLFWGNVLIEKYLSLFR
jgi:leader peptidase (prepilin peptidase)/N-methyltransferase